MTRHDTAPDRPVLCCEFSQQLASRAVHALNRAICYRNLLVPDSIGGLQDSPEQEPGQTQVKRLSEIHGHGR